MTSKVDIKGLVSLKFLCPWGEGRGGGVMKVASAVPYNFLSLHKCSIYSFTTYSYIREYWIIYRGFGVLAIVWFGSLPTFVPLSREQVVTGIEFTDGRGGGSGRGELQNLIWNGRYSCLRINNYVDTYVPDFQTKPADSKPIRRVLICRFKNGGGVRWKKCPPAF